MLDFGFFVKDIMVKVTNPVARYDKVARIPVAVGFKQRDKTWVNEWMDVVVFPDLFQAIELVEKGDRIKVSGRLQLSEYTNKSGEVKKQWSIIADSVSSDKQGEDRPKTADYGEIPF